MTKLANGEFTDGPTISPIVTRTSDRYAKAAGLWFEARFNHPRIGLVVLPYATFAEAAASRLK